MIKGITPQIRSCVFAGRNILRSVLNLLFVWILACGLAELALAVILVSDFYGVSVSLFGLDFLMVVCCYFVVVVLGGCFLFVFVLFVLFCCCCCCCCVFFKVLFLLFLFFCYGVQFLFDCLFYLFVCLFVVVVYTEWTKLVKLEELETTCLSEYCCSAPRVYLIT